jgi:hypothetical protein
MIVTERTVADVAQGRLGLTGIRVARFRQHIALGLRKTVERGVPVLRAGVVGQGAPGGRKIE